MKSLWNFDSGMTFAMVFWAFETRNRFRTNHFCKCISKQSIFSNDTSNIYSTIIKITLKENLIRFWSIFYDELVAANYVLIIYICLSKISRKEIMNKTIWAIDYIIRFIFKLSSVKLYSCRRQTIAVIAAAKLEKFLVKDLSFILFW